MIACLREVSQHVIFLSFIPTVFSNYDFNPNSNSFLYFNVKCSVDIKLNCLIFLHFSYSFELYYLMISTFDFSDSVRLFFIIWIKNIFKVFARVFYKTVAMDSTSNGRRNTRSRPSFTNLNFASQTRGNRFQNEMEDNLPPGTIPTNLSLGQFSPYSGQMMISSNFSSSGPSSHNIASPNPIFQRTPSVPSQGVNSRRLLSSHPSFGSTQITTEHLLNTYSQESVGKLKIDPLGEVRFQDFVAYFVYTWIYTV